MQFWEQLCGRQGRQKATRRATFSATEHDRAVLEMDPAVDFDVGPWPERFQTPEGGLYFFKLPHGIEAPSSRHVVVRVVLLFVVVAVVVAVVVVGGGVSVLVVVVVVVVAVVSAAVVVARYMLVCRF